MKFLFHSLDIRALLIFTIGRNYLIIFTFAEINFLVCITVYGTLDTMLAARAHSELLLCMRTCTLEPPDPQISRFYFATFIQFFFTRD